MIPEHVTGNSILGSCLIVGEGKALKAIPFGLSKELRSEVNCS